MRTQRHQANRAQIVMLWHQSILLTYTWWLPSVPFSSEQLWGPRTPKVCSGHGWLYAFAAIEIACPNIGEMSGCYQGTCCPSWTIACIRGNGFLGSTTMGGTSGAGGTIETFGTSGGSPGAYGGTGGPGSSIGGFMFGSFLHQRAVAAGGKRPCGRAYFLS
jgi:hypothetical protein